MVEIIPKFKEGQPALIQAFFVFSVGALLAALGGFFVFMFLEVQSQKEAERLDTVLAAEKTQEQIALEQEIFAARSRLQDFSVIATQHTNPLTPFLFLESVVHPEVVFLSADFSAKTQSMQLTGSTSSFRTLEEQLLALKEQEKQGVQSFLSALQLAEKGGVNFKIALQFSPNFKIAPVSEPLLKEEI